MQKATFGSGCFWCVEAIYKQLEGVEKVTSGYSGGKIANPTYREVCSGLTGHAEVVQIEYDEDKVCFTELLEVFFKTHDPTTLNRQGADKGTQYRSAIFYHTTDQQEEAEKVKRKLDQSGAFEDPIVTEISEFYTFYPAEDHHQDYFENNPEQAYCQMVVRPKVEKFRQVFGEKLKA